LENLINHQVKLWIRNNYFKSEVQEQIRNVVGITELSGKNAKCFINLKESEFIEKKKQYESSLETSFTEYSTAVESSTEISESESSVKKRNRHLALMSDPKPKKKKKVVKLGFEVHRVRCTVRRR
jgi:hypothetical protein